jgi:aminopeptidase YwaD
MRNCQRIVTNSLIGLMAACLATTAAGGEPSADWLDPIDIPDLKRHASFLASDTLEGRQAGTRGGQAAAGYLAAELRKLGLSPAGAGGDFRQPFGANYANVVARRNGSDPARRQELIVVGAHYDHVGYGNASNSNGPFGVIHNGADDNASGVSALLEIAQALSQDGVAPARTVVFGFWDGEEINLLGSQHWVSTQPNVAAVVKLAVNLDMVGRLRDDGVHVMGWRTAPGLRTDLARANHADRVTLQFPYAITPDSDHYSFYRYRIPVLHFDTGKHEDYHRPSDDVERLNWIGLQQITRMTAQLVLQAANAESLPPFRQEVFAESSPARSVRSGRVSPPVRFGFTWQPAAAARGIVEVAEVLPGLPAAAAGLRPGDRLLQFGRWQQGTLEDLRTEITVAPAETTLTWQRSGEPGPTSAAIRLRGEPVRWGARCRLDPAQPGCVIVTEVIATSPAARAGLQPSDVVVSVDDQPVTQSAWDQLAQHEEPVRLAVERFGRIRHLSARSLNSEGSALSERSESASQP